MPTGWFIVSPPAASTAAAALKRTEPVLGGGQRFDGSIAPIALKKVAATMGGSMAADAAMNVALKKLTVSILGSQSQAGALAVSLPRVSHNFTQDLFTGAMFSTLRPVKLEFALQLQGAVAARLETVDALLTSTQEITGALATQLQHARAVLAGGQEQDGVMASSLKKAAPTAAGTHTQVSFSHTPSGSSFDTNFFGQNWNLGMRLESGLLRPNDRGGAADFGRVMYRNGITVKQQFTSDGYYIEAVNNGAGGDDRGLMLYIGVDSPTAITKWMGFAIYGGGNAYLCRSANQETALATAVAASMTNLGTWRLSVEKVGLDYVYKGSRGGSVITTWTDVNGATYGTPGQYAAIGSSTICQGFGNYQCPNSWQGPITVGQL